MREEERYEGEKEEGRGKDWKIGRLADKWICRQTDREISRWICMEEGKIEREKEREGDLH